MLHFLYVVSGVIRSRRDSSHSKTMRQPAMVWLSSRSSTSQNNSAGSHSPASESIERISRKFQTLTNSGLSIGVEDW